MQVWIPTSLLSYTKAQCIEAEGSTLDELLQDIDQRYPGLRFRVVDEQERLRGHMRFFVNGEQTFDLACRLRSSDVVHLVQALSGG